MQLGATSSSSNILSFCGGLSNGRLLARRPRHKRRSKKLRSPQSGLPLNMTTNIIYIEIPTKRKKGGQKPKTKLGCETKVPEDSLDGLTIRCARRRLKARAQADCELDVRSHCHQVQQGSDHASVFLLVHNFSLLVFVQGHHGRHGC
jgi:hypothetical protein